MFSSVVPMQTEDSDDLMDDEDGSDEEIRLVDLTEAKTVDDDQHEHASNKTSSTSALIARLRAISSQRKQQKQTCKEVMKSNVTAFFFWAI